MPAVDALATGLAASRAFAVGALFVIFGTLLMATVIARPTAGDGGATDPRRGFVALTRGAVLAAVLGLGLWFWLQTAAMAQTATIGEMLARGPAVLLHTDFGHLMLLRLGLLGGIGFALAADRLGPATVLAGFEAALQAGHLHALAIWHGPSLLLASEALHVLAAASWLGSLPALLLLVVTVPPGLAMATLRRFSFMGFGAVLVVGGTAVLQADWLAGGPLSLPATAYGRICLAKMVLFGLLLALALRNRWRLRRGAEAVPALRSSLRAALVLAALVLVLAAILSAMPPPRATPDLTELFRLGQFRDKFL